MSKQLMCPMCLVQFDLSEVIWVDANRRPVDPRPRPAGPSLWTKLPGRRPEVTMADYVRWAAQGNVPECPENHRLPPEMPDRRNIVVGLVGETGSSKSHFLTALVHQLETDDMPARLGLDVSPPSGPSADLYVTEYYRRVFQERTALNATKPHDQQAQERLPIVLVVREMTTGRESNLIIFDAAGEQMRSGTDVARFNRFLYMAKILVFFVTPSSLPRVDSRVNDPGRTQQSPVGTRAMFDQVERQMRQARGVQQGQLDVFASVVLAKADLYQGLEGFDDSLLEEPLYDNLSDTLWRLKDESDQVAQIMTGYGAGNLVGTLDNRFPNCTFHAVSATGASPDEHGRFERIAPVKCIDPLIVPLYRLGLLTEQQQPAGDGW